MKELWVCSTTSFMMDAKASHMALWDIIPSHNPSSLPITHHPFPSWAQWRRWIPMALKVDHKCNVTNQGPMDGGGPTRCASWRKKCLKLNKKKRMIGWANNQTPILSHVQDLKCAWYKSISKLERMLEKEWSCLISLKCSSKVNLHPSLHPPLKVAQRRYAQRCHYRKKFPKILMRGP